MRSVQARMTVYSGADMVAISLPRSAICRGVCLNSGGAPRKEMLLMFGRTMSRALVVLTALSLVLMSVGTALADTINPEGDVLHSDTNLNISGVACSQLTWATKAIIKYSGGSHFADSAVVSVSSAPDTAAAAAGITTAGNGDITMPSNWASAANSESRADQVHNMSVILPANLPDGTYKINMTATGPKDPSGTLTLPSSGNAFFNIIKDCTVVTPPPGNSAPVLDAVGDQSIAEGSTLAFTLSATDANLGDTLTYSMSGDVAGMSLNASTGAFSWTPGDNYVRSVTFTASDGTVADDDSETVTITSTNVAPTTSGAAFAADLMTPFKFNASFNYSDAGWLDTHGGSSISWTVNGASYAAASTVSPAADTLDPPQTGSVASSITLGPGCYTLAASGTAVDDDGGSSAVSFTTGFEETPLDVPTAAFLAPIKDSERNFAKWGNVLPVKVSLMSSCNPGQQLSANLYLSYIQGTSGETITGDEVITTSVSSADSGNVMRLNDSFYIYNFATKPLTAGKDYTLRVRYGAANGPVILTAVLNLKK